MAHVLASSASSVLLLRTSGDKTCTMLHLFFSETYTRVCLEVTVKPPTRGSEERALVTKSAVYPETSQHTSPPCVHTFYNTFMLYMLLSVMEFY